MIEKTGYWTSDTDIVYHSHSQSVSNWILNFLKDHKDTQIYDFGCGLGNYLKDLENDGFQKLKGIEKDPIKTDHNFEILKLDLAKAFQLEEKGIIISLEVGEHLPPEYQNTFLQNLKDNCDKYLILSWAIKGQGGYGHFNELDNEEVIPMIEALGFTYLEEISQEIRQVPEDKYWYFKNTLMVFEKVN